MGVLGHRAALHTSKKQWKNGLKPASGESSSLSPNRLVLSASLAVVRPVMLRHGGGVKVNSENVPVPDA